MSAVEGTIAVGVFLVASFVLVTWFLRESPGRKSRAKHSFAPLNAEGSEKRHRFRDRDFESHDDVSGGGAGDAGSD